MILNTWLFRGLMLLVLLAPLPLGANREWAWTACAVAVAGLGLLWSVSSALQPRDVSTSLPMGPIIAFLAVLAWALVQMFRGPADPLWDLGAEVLADSLPGVISLSPGDTGIAVMRLATYGLVFWLSFQFAREATRAREALRWLVAAGLVYTVYGLVMFWGEFGMLLWFEDTRYNADVRGTFVNRNHYATWLGLSIVCMIGVFHQKVALRRNPAYRVPRTRDRRFEQWLLKIWKPLMVIILLSAGLVLSHSRAGFASVFIGVVLLLWLIHRRQPIGNRRTRAAMALGLGLAALVFWMTSSVLLERVDRVNADVDARFDAYELTREAIADNPMTGFGYGTYADSFRLYRDERLERHYNKAHNTYLENTFELGWPAAGLLFGSLAWLLWLCWRGALRRGRDWIYPAVALGGAAIAGVHSLFDFSLQIPAIAITFACLLGVGVAQSLPTREQG